MASDIGVKCSIRVSGTDFFDMVEEWLSSFLIAFASDGAGRATVNEGIAASALFDVVDNAPWSAVAWVSRDQGGYVGTTGEQLSAESFEWFRSELESGAVWRFGVDVLSASGEPRYRIDVELIGAQDADHQWAQLRVIVPAREFGDEQLESLLVDALEHYSSLGVVSYAEISTSSNQSNTMLEDARAGGETLDELVESSFDSLRGYAWVTAVPATLVGRLHREPAVEQSLFDVRELASGALWIRATRRFNEYDSIAAGRVFELVQPVLRGALPRHRDYPGYRPYPLVYASVAK